MEELIRHRILVNSNRPRNDRNADIPRQLRYERISVDGDILSYVPNDEHKVGVCIAAHPLTPENNYFEVEILDTGLIGAIGIGLVPPRYPLDRQPGWNASSIAYHADDGKLFKATGFGRPFGHKCHIGDVVGCGVRFENADGGGPFQDVRVFFTRNDKEIGNILMLWPATGLYPAIGLHSEGEEVKMNLDAEWLHEEIILMSVDNCDEEWSRLYDVKLNGSVLEYTGRGKSINDVGLAQGRFALDTTCHYFEIEVVNPGENCYIAIGLARRDYPKHRHPGWNKGSIAYHADDGKLFVGSGVGEPFGPRCHKGDVMGCGILFPRDYIHELEAEGVCNGSPDNPDYNIHDLLDGEEYDNNSSSDDEDWLGKPVAEHGIKVHIFFTRNGKAVGQREIHIPRGGFYPTIGMLSSDEKVKFDLRPLTG